MKLSASNIAWSPSQNELVYTYLQQAGFSGLEIAPSLFVDHADPYSLLQQAHDLKDTVHALYHLQICSMQSVLFGVQERIFSSAAEMESVFAYLQRALQFAQTIGCHNLVFGCPRNRVLPDPGNDKAPLAFFTRLAQSAAAFDCVIALEANPPIYHTNFLNTTAQAFDFCSRAAEPALMVNLDLGTLIETGETPNQLRPFLNLVHHVHFSEPGLLPLQKRGLHQEIIAMLRDAGYPGLISIEQKNTGSLDDIFRSIDYVRDICQE